jgi:hypothetical protein
MKGDITEYDSRDEPWTVENWLALLIASCQQNQQQQT